MSHSFHRLISLIMLAISQGFTRCSCNRCCWLTNASIGCPACVNVRGSSNCCTTRARELRTPGSVVAGSVNTARVPRAGMAGSLKQSSLFGRQTQSQTTQSLRSIRQRPGFGPVVAGTWKKVNKLDDAWKKGFWGSGYFNEGNASADNNYLKRIEGKKLLSSLEKSGLLSKADKAGLTLSRIEQAKLLSTAENLGLLAILERLLVTDPGKVTALSIPFFIAAAGTLVAFPHDNAPLQALQFLLVALTAGVSVTFFTGGFVLAAIQDE